MTRELEVALATCDREPIQIPGAIQPHGVLFVLSPSALTVMQVSENVTNHLEMEAHEVLGKPLEHLLTPASAQRVAAALAPGHWKDENPLRIATRRSDYDGIVHEHDGVVILELEPAHADAGASRTHRPLLSAIQRAGTLDELSTLVVAAVKRLTGFERVMLYRFSEDGTGSVDAEAKEASLQPYLGLRYPASDIPKQARELYRKNWLRIVPDRVYVPSRLVPAQRPDTGAPLDLSFSVLRSVSPIHLQYLENMGVRASMSASLIVGDRLWGLIACHNHSAPLLVPYEVRSAIEVLARVVSLQIGAFADREAASIRHRRQGTREVLANRTRDAHEERSVLLPLLSSERELLQLVAADGAAVVTHDNVATCGLAPETPMIRTIAAWFDEHAGVAPFATSELPRLFPAALEAKDVASGALSFALPGTPRRRIIWFRREVIHTVNWSGDPHKPVEAPSVPTMAQSLHPRHSFELWKEEVSLESQRWTASDIEAATDLLRSLVEIDLDRQVAREQRAIRVREDLMAYVSHDLRNPLSTILITTAALKMGLVGPCAGDSMFRAQAATEKISRAAEQMNKLIADLLDAARIEAGHFSIHSRPEPIDDIISESAEIAEPRAHAKHITLRTNIRDHGLVWADRERVFQLLSNLLGNAIKFTPEGGTVELAAKRRDGGVLFTVEDTGPGISPDDLSRIFDRYWHKPTKRGGGSGLGLSISKGIVEAHGGKIWAESVPGAGARFYFVLPSDDSSAG